MEIALDILVSVVSLLIVGQFTWALRGHFTSTSMTRRAQLISLAVIVTTLGYFFLVWWQAQPATAQIIGVVVELGGLALFWAAISASRQAKLRFAFDDEHPHSLVTSGPYRRIRHPFYTSYLIFWIGWGIAAWSPWSVVAVVVMIALYAWAALTEERKFSATPLAGDYEAYKRQAGFFWPRIAG